MLSPFRCLILWSYILPFNTLNKTELSRWRNFIKKDCRRDIIIMHTSTHRHLKNNEIVEYIYNTYIQIKNN